jgi:flagellar hook-basal body complex protein FliE
MDNIQIVEVQNTAGELIEHVIVEHSDGSFTSMLKSTYDEIITKQEAARPHL